VADPEPHSRECYARQATQRGGYFHPWKRVLGGPDPEAGFDLVLQELLATRPRVLEAGCGHGPDAARSGGLSASWTAYDRQPELLDLAARAAPQAELVLWDGKGGVPDALLGPFDLIVSRRGPTSVIPHLPTFAAPDARFLYIGPRLDVPEVPRRLSEIGWDLLGEWRTRVRAWLPSEADYLLRCEFMNEVPDRELWQRDAGPRGLPYFEERYTVLAAAE
jgi:SAM-dependent methyltransferase